MAKDAQPDQLLGDPGHITWAPTKLITRKPPPQIRTKSSGDLNGAAI